MRQRSQFFSAAGLSLLGMVAIVTIAPVSAFADNWQDHSKDEQDEPDECEGIFPGDGRAGPALSYTDNGNGTFTDNNTKLQWEKKNPPGCSSTDVHCVGNTYTWSTGGDAFNGPRLDGTIFTEFLPTLNNTCERDPAMVCTTNQQCASQKKGKCGLAGHRDWRLPNVRELQSIVDYSIASTPSTNPLHPPVCHLATAASVPGATAQEYYWSSTPIFNTFGDPGTWAEEWGVNFLAGNCHIGATSVGALSFIDANVAYYARAVRDCH